MRGYVVPEESTASERPSKTINLGQYQVSVSQAGAPEKQQQQQQRQQQQQHSKQRQQPANQQQQQQYPGYAESTELYRPRAQ